MSAVGETCEYLLDPDNPETWGGEEGDECYVNSNFLNKDGVWSCPHDTEPGEDLCIFHLPVTDKDNNESVDAFLNTIREATEGGRSETQVRKLQFVGARFDEFQLNDGSANVLAEVPAIEMDHVQINGYFKCSVDISKISFRGATFGDEVAFESTEFKGLVDFTKAEFYKVADFSKTQFGGTATFYGATFVGDVDFSASPRDQDLRFEGETNFYETEFTGDVDFSYLVFGGETNFLDTEFGGAVEFYNSQFRGDAQFRNTVFREAAEFSSAEFRGEAQFGSAEFEGEADFFDTQFGEEADFFDAQFGQGVNFVSAEFGGKANFGANFGMEAQFQEAIFGGEADFKSAEFRGEAQFNRVEFGGEADFFDTEFVDSTSFEKAKFNDGPNFSRASIKSGNFEGADLEHADFDEADLSGANLERAKLSNADLFGTDLSGTRLYGARFGGAVINVQTIFDGHGNHRCVYDPHSEYEYEPDDGEYVGQLRKAMGVYHLLEQLTRANTLPDEHAKFFTRRQDMRRAQLRQDEDFPRYNYWFAEAQNSIFRHGESFSRVVAWSVGTIVTFTLLYPLGGWVQSDSTGTITYASIKESPTLLWKSFHHSTLLFLTGGGPLTPTDVVAEILTTIEALVAPIFLALLVFVLGRRAAR